VDWRQFFDQLRAFEGNAPPGIYQELIAFYDSLPDPTALAGDAHERDITLIGDASPDDISATVEQVARALQTGDAEALTRYASRHVPNGTPHSRTHAVLSAGAAPLLDLLNLDDTTAARRYVCAQACLLALSGVPGISFEALFGLRENPTDTQSLLQDLADESTQRYRLVSRFLALLSIRRAHSAFHPAGQQIVLDLSSAVFGLERISPDGRERVVALHNVTAQIASVEFSTGGVRRWRNLHLDEPVDIPAVFTYRIVLSPYQVAWMRAE
jgi:hypothetical protein